MKPINISFIDKETGKHATAYLEKPEELTEEEIVDIFKERLLTLKNYLK